MGGSSSGGGGGNSGGGGGGDNKPVKKATPAKKATPIKKATPKKSNGTSKYFKKTSTPKKKVSTNSGRAGNGGVGSAAVKVSARVKVTPKVVKKPATVTKSKAVTTPLASPKIVSSPTPNIVSSPNGGRAGGGGVGSIAAKVSDRARAPAPTVNKITPVVTPKAIAKPTEPINISKDNKTVAEEPKYDQKYWADQRAKGVSQADMKAEQDKVGIKKAYSGDKVVTADMKRRAADDLKRVTGSMATIQNKGVTKTEEKSGLLGEKLDTTYDYKGGPSIVTRATDPTIGGVRFGEKTSTTFVDGTEVATKTGHDPLGYDAKVTRPDIAGNIDDTQPIDPAKTAENIKSIDAEIKNETDPVKLKALHKRRLMLMRLRNTNTRFAGLLDDADTKRSILTSIR